MKFDYSGLKVGDKVWWSDVNSRGAGLTVGQVMKVGRVLITAQSLYQGRPYGRSIVFRKEDGRTNDDYRHQFLIPDLELYETEKRTNAAMWKLSEAIKYGRRQDGVTEADIKEAAKLLKVNIE